MFFLSAAPVCGCGSRSYEVNLLRSVKLHSVFHGNRDKWRPVLSLRGNCSEEIPSRRQRWTSQEVPKTSRDSELHALIFLHSASEKSIPLSPSQTVFRVLNYCRTSDSIHQTIKGCGGMCWTSVNSQSYLRLGKRRKWVALQWSCTEGLLSETERIFKLLKLAAL